MPIDCYYLPGSAPCRAVLMTAKAVGLDMNQKIVDLIKKEHLTPEFIKMNPQHVLPTVNDNGFILWESRTIMRYLVDKYAKNDSLYPKDVQKRAIIDQRLDFDMGTLYANFAAYHYPVLFLGGEFDPALLVPIHEGLKILDYYVSQYEFAAGDHLTIADFTFLATISTYELCDFDFSAYKNVSKWYAKAKAAFPHYEETNAKNSQKLRDIYTHVMANRQK